MTDARSTARDVAAYILHTRATGLSRWALHKLMYYCQAWALVWENRPLFAEPIQAWKDGPVCQPLWVKQEHGTGIVPMDVLDGDTRRIVDAVVNFYGQRQAAWLRELTHREPPWVESRGNCPPDERSSQEISHEAMKRYYAGLNVPKYEFSESFEAALDVLVDTPLDVAPIDEAVIEDASGYQHWLTTGEGDHWAARYSN